MSRFGQHLVVLAAGLVFVAGMLVGVKLLFADPPPPPEKPLCEPRTVQVGEKLTSNLVMVNVYNAGKKAGLANRVRINLERNGFLGGVTANNPGEVKASNVTILTKDPKNPKVVLLAQQFKGKVAYAEADFELETGLSVIVGSKFKGVNEKAKREVTLKVPVQVCVPTIELP